MSFWIKKTEQNDRFVYSVSIPFEVLLVIVALVGGIVGPRYLNNPISIATDSISLIFIGFILFFASKISLFVRGEWNSWGAKNMKAPFKVIYRIGYIFMITGFFIIVTIILPRTI